MLLFIVQHPAIGRFGLRIMSAFAVLPPCNIAHFLDIIALFLEVIALYGKYCIVCSFDVVWLSTIKAKNMPVTCRDLGHISTRVNYSDVNDSKPIYASYR